MKHVNEGPSIMRMFEVRPKPGCEAALARHLAATSVDVVRGEPGNLGHLFGRPVPADEGVFLFVSFWASLDAVKARFGPDWAHPHLPEGYAELIAESCVRHFAYEGRVTEPG